MNSSGRNLRENTTVLFHGMRLILATCEIRDADRELHRFMLLARDVPEPYDPGPRVI